MRDRDVERGLDLPQVRVERPAQVGERAVVERRERELVPLASCRSCPRAPRSFASAALRLARGAAVPQRHTPAGRIGAFSASSSVPADSIRCARVAASRLPLAAAVLSCAESCLASSRKSAVASAGVAGAGRVSTLAMRRRCSRCRSRRGPGIEPPVFSSLQIEPRSAAKSSGSVSACSRLGDLDFGIEEARQHGVAQELVQRARLQREHARAQAEVGIEPGRREVARADVEIVDPHAAQELRLEAEAVGGEDAGREELQRRALLVGRHRRQRQVARCRRNRGRNRRRRRTWR